MGLSCSTSSPRFPLSPSRPLAICLLFALPQLFLGAQGPFLPRRPAADPALTRLDPLPQGLDAAVGNSLAFLARPEAARYYRQLDADEFTPERVRRTLLRFRELLTAKLEPREFAAAVRDAFEFHPVAGAVLFTGYYEPVFEASRT